MLSLQDDLIVTDNQDRSYQSATFSPNVDLSFLPILADWGLIVNFSRSFGFFQELEYCLDVLSESDPFSIQHHFCLI